jgi:hypothetical protein
MTSDVRRYPLNSALAEVEMPAIDLQLSHRKGGEPGAWTDRLTRDAGRGRLRDDRLDALDPSLCAAAVRRARGAYESDIDVAELAGDAQMDHSVAVIGAELSRLCLVFGAAI